MLTIRLARTGRKKLAHYRVVVADSRRATTGRFIAQLGHYNPHTKELVLDDAQTQKYIDNGAQPSSRVARIMKSYKGVKLPVWAEANIVTKAEKPKEKTEESVEAAPETEEKAEPVEEAAPEKEKKTEEKKPEKPEEKEEAKEEPEEKKTEEAEKSGEEKEKSA